MRWIRKANEPSLLQNYRRQVNASFEDLDKDVKDELRQSLFHEQFGVCAYCQQKLSHEDGIPNSDYIKIEHHCERSICNGTDGQTDRTLDYSNLMVVCLGKGGINNDLHCDTYKATLDINSGLPITISPTNNTHMNTISYSSTGLINSSNADYNKEINNILKLNLPHLKEMRKKKWLLIFKNSRVRSGQPNKNKMEKLLSNDLATKEGRFSNHFPGLSEFMLKKFCP